MSQTIQLDCSMTINEIIARYPQTIPVFNELGLDTCCGGSVPIDEAARHDGLDADTVLAVLRRAVEAGE